MQRMWIQGKMENWSIFAVSLPYTLMDGYLTCCHCCCCYCSVAKSCLTHCDPIEYSTSLSPEFAQTHVHWVGDANHLILCHLLLLLSSKHSITQHKIQNSVLLWLYSCIRSHSLYLALISFKSGHGLVIPGPICRSGGEGLCCCKIDHPVEWDQGMNFIC